MHNDSHDLSIMPFDVSNIANLNIHCVDYHCICIIFGISKNEAIYIYIYMDGYKV